MQLNTPDDFMNLATELQRLYTDTNNTLDTDPNLRVKKLIAYHLLSSAKLARETGNAMLETARRAAQVKADPVGPPAGGRS